MTIGNEILNQLGGGQFIAMTGSKNFTGLKDGLQFSFPGCKKANKCRITLTDMDIYYVEFYKISTSWVDLEKAFIPVETYSFVYCDQLQDIFKSFTGLDTRL